MDHMASQPTINQSSTSISAVAAERVLGRFQQWNMDVGRTAKDAIVSLLEALEDGLHGRAQAGYSLASLDPGMGKTESVLTFLDVWKEQGFQPDASILIGLSRKEEIETYIDRSGLSDADYAVLTTDDTLNAKGNQNHGQARVLFTTQQMIASRTQRSTFAEASEFHYRGRPRTLRIWDEAFVPALHVTISPDAMRELFGRLRQTAPAFVEALAAFVSQVDGMNEGEVVSVPGEFQRLLDESAAYRAYGWKALSDRQRRTLNDLLIMSEREMIAVPGSWGGRELVGSSRGFPDDFAPAVILDASGRVRGTYSLWETHRGGLHRVASASNHYGPLNVHLWKQGASKSTLRDEARRKETLRAIADLIQGKPDEAWLIIHPQDYSFEIPDELRSMLGIDETNERVRFVHYGNHHGTNGHRNVQNVVVIGLWSYPDPAYLALGMAASGLPASSIDDTQREALKAAEWQHHLLQALCRASVRKATGGSCGPCTAYVISSAKTQPEQLLADTFPGCAIHPWQPVKPKLTGHAANLAAYLLERFAEPQVDWVSKAEAARAVGIKNNLAKVLKSDALQELLTENRIGQQTKGFRRLQMAEQS